MIKLKHKKGEPLRLITLENILPLYKDCTKSPTSPFSEMSIEQFTCTVYQIMVNQDFTETVNDGRWSSY